MTALAVNEVVCSKNSEFLNANEDKSTETTTDSMKLAMAVDDDAMAHSIETTELSNGFAEIIDEKNSKESFLSVSDSVHSDSTSQHGTPGTPRSEHSTPMEDVDDNCSIKLVLSDDEEDAELETTVKGTEKIASIKTENIEEPSKNVEAANQNEKDKPENVDRIEADPIIPMSLDETESHELAEDNTENSNVISTENQNDVSVKDILSELDSCLTEENDSNLDRSNINDIEMGEEVSEETLATDKQNNEKEENNTDFQINDVLTQEEDAKSSNDSNEGDFQISIVSTEGNIQIDSISTEEGIQTNNADIQINNVTTEADIQISNVSTEADIQISNVSTETDIQMKDVSTEGDIQISSISTEAEMQISNSVSVGDEIKISNVSTEEDYDKEFKLSMEENFDNDKSEEENEKQETKTDEDTTDNDEIMNDESEKSEENGIPAVIDLDEISDEDKSDENKDSNITNETENNVEIKIEQTEISENVPSDTECVETSTKRTSEAFKRKIDESDELEECTETKKMKTDPIKSKSEDNSKLDQVDDTCQTELNEKDSSIKPDNDKTINKDRNKTIENDENQIIKKNETKTIEKEVIETIEKDTHKAVEEVENEKDEDKTNEKIENKTKEIDENKSIEKDQDEIINKDDDKTIGKNKIKTVEKDENKTKAKDQKKPPETKKKLILRMLPLLFENEPIPNVNVEELILTKIIEGITLRTELATLRQKAQTQEQLIDQLRRKATHLSKQLEDINTVTHRLTIDLQNKDRPVAPVKITRSVGLQVSISSTPAPKRFSSSNPPNTINKKRPITNSTHHNNSSTTNNNNSSATNYNNSSSNNNLSATNTSQSNINSNSPVKTSTPTTPSKSPSLLTKALTKPTSGQRNALVSHSTPPKQQSESPAKQTKTSDSKSVTVDLTDDDTDSSKNNSNSVVTQNPPGLIPLTTGNLRVVSSLGNTLSTTTTTNQPQRVTYLMATPGQNRVLIATSPATTGGARPALTVVGQPNVRGVQGTRYLVNTTNGQQAIVQRPGIVLTNGQTTNTVRTVPVRVNSNVTRANALTNNRPANPTLHPAPLPILLNQPHLPNWRQIPPRPALRISRTKDGGIQLSWSMPELDQKIHEEVASYQLYAYQEGAAPPSTELWRKVGDVKALPLPMACTLTSFHPGNKYYFAVRAIDVHSRVSQFSYAQPISLHN
ncbi:histone-lysine N-methyltransferase, H3 lysine-79 specific-like [Chrysoperla carnea]|uniref:histone-lysine N-methyltransferase, H3 lysine-79 specific-like n=1 Tax=Chrysoperla carnea TaxID=189513 RepID=UPI001D07384D|nr:histone-lysine N-methyltransferase, H3 lysine-79 specific-like [Chrysoperla carnea]XP_044737089.1 histone-lysine N-methyltransferase, H3 lysine-79 specific-like [Chrysoperla carnea]XP_044737090.1 histone-lysine N-methyltransferase, H3 lysine-79 specific-like [Chrysoperla carnea]